jgi:hypothetical protein
MKNESTRSSLEKCDRDVINALKDTANLLGAMLAASRMYRETGCTETAAAYEKMIDAHDALLAAWNSAHIASVMDHKRLAGIDIPAQTKPVSVVERVFGASPITAPVIGNDVPAWMRGEQMELD